MRNNTSALIDTHWMPHLVQATYRKGMPLVRQRKESALHEVNEYLNINNVDRNGQRIFNAMVFDVDAGDALAAWQLADLPFQPRYFAGTWKRFEDHGELGLHRAHIVIQLATPVHAASKKSVKLFAIIYNEIVRRLEAHGAVVDCGASGIRGTVAAAIAGQKTITKNPESEAWNAVPGDLKLWELRALAEALDIDTVARNGIDAAWHGRKRINEDNLGAGRNCDLFEIARHRIYDQKQYVSSLDEMKEVARSICAELNDELNANTRKGKLPLAEVQHTADCMARWTWEFYTGRSKETLKKPYNQGAARRMVAPHDSADESVKRAIGAMYTHAIRARASHAVVQECIAGMKLEGVKVTATEVARRTGMTRKTVSKYLDEAEPKSVVAARNVAAGVRVIVPSDRRKITRPAPTKKVGNMPRIRIPKVQPVKPKPTMLHQLLGSTDAIQVLQDQIRVMDDDYSRRMQAYRQALTMARDHIPEPYADEGRKIRQLAGTIFTLNRQLCALRAGNP